MCCALLCCSLSAARQRGKRSQALHSSIVSQSKTCCCCCCDDCWQNFDATLCIWCWAAEASGLVLQCSETTCIMKTQQRGKAFVDKCQHGDWMQVHRGCACPGLKRISKEIVCRQCLLVPCLEALVQMALGRDGERSESRVHMCDWAGRECQPGVFVCYECASCEHSNARSAVDARAQMFVLQQACHSSCVAKLMA